MSSLFGMESISLRRAEIYVNKSKGVNCTYGFNSRANKWLLGSFILNNLKANAVSFIIQKKKITSNLFQNTDNALCGLNWTNFF